MKLILCLILIFCFLYIGLQYVQLYRNRVNYMKDFREFLKTSKIKINYNNQSVPDLINDYNFSSKYLKIDLFNYLNFLKDKNQYCLSKFLEKDDSDLIDNFLKDIGRKDKIDTLKFIDKYILEVENRYTKLVEDEKKNSKLSFKLFLAFGITICILLI